MELPEDEAMSATTTTTSVYVRAIRVEALNKAATKVSYETNSPKQMSPSGLARYLIDNYLDVAVKKLIDDSKR
ncbi:MULTISPECIES: hypothetical protein [Pseudomonas]|jgi:DNA repair protein RadC|uniref:hypothetical protein n=1 Tax=Pseudomonas TaxID=286 RepID=UPI000652EB9B|nr:MULTISPECIES: hypothetical protein [Pseudomonas]KMN16265.1 hypothetical protein TU87_21845 [Pseudomonas weihenstephanensis]PMX06794.1 hypothetical protein C1Y25_26475 [Pseudomonas sp. MPBC4-3]PMX44210.1 hypothetical protein C1Y20_26560 [Pseudomonas sp. FW301-21B01]PMY03365.1 hypothetical protein C1Y18_26330 [Pseudomonas sp. MPR-R5A]PNA64425.1 hypothetical protein C1Y14_25610 [Pseudomonas sp. MPR-R5B]